MDCKHGVFQYWTSISYFLLTLTLAACICFFYQHVERFDVQTLWWFLIAGLSLALIYLRIDTEHLTQIPFQTTLHFSLALTLIVSCMVLSLIAIILRVACGTQKCASVHWTFEFTLIWVYPILYYNIFILHVLSHFVFALRQDEQEDQEDQMEVSRHDLFEINFS